MRAAVLILVAACHSGGGSSPHRETTGAITGITWDHDTGNAIAGAEIHADLAGHRAARPVRSAPGGIFDFKSIAPGRYTLRGTFQGQTVNGGEVDVVAGQGSFAKLPFKLGHPEDINLTVDASAFAEITRYHPPDLTPNLGVIEGFVIEGQTHEVVAGAVVNATSGGASSAMQVVSDDRGRYRFDTVAPGTYVISADYSVGKRGHIEVRRSDITVVGGEAVVVPLIVEMTK